jgi:hypothetical protein
MTIRHSTLLTGVFNFMLYSFYSDSEHGILYDILRNVHQTAIPLSKIPNKASHICHDEDFHHLYITFFQFITYDLCKSKRVHNIERIQ